VINKFLITILITCLASSNMAEANFAWKLIDDRLMISQTGTTYTQVAAGDVHTCALTSVGGVKCWGYNRIGELGDGSVTHTQRNSPVDVVGLASGVTQLATGYGHICAVTSVGGVKCWGSNDSGQLGDGTTNDRYTPVEVVGLESGVRQVALGSYFSCALTTSGGVKCWGENYFGQLGDGTTNQSNLPVTVIGLENGVTQLAAGDFHICALTIIGGVMCWGDNSSGQLGDNTTTNRSTPVDVYDMETGFAQVTGGGAHTCALTLAGGVKCWGANFSGQLGDDSTTQRNVPVGVVGLTGSITYLAAGQYHTCAVTASGGAKCWGDNGFGILGDGSTTQQNVPVDVVGLNDGVSQLAAGSSHTCAVTLVGGIKCWGWDLFGQLGDGKIGQRNTPVDVVDLTGGVNQLAAGDSHTCALTSVRGVKCWGNNIGGQLGDGTFTDRGTPVDVLGLDKGIIQVTNGGYHTCALTEAGAVVCWGSNNVGQLGNPIGWSSSTPVEVVGLAGGVHQLVAGWFHTCALTADGGVKCWGYNDMGQLGDGTNTDRDTPVDVVGLTSGVSQLVAGFEHTCALTTTGEVKCWGWNSSGQLGNPTVWQSTTPVDVIGLTGGVSQLAAGIAHTCALSLAGGVKCWGDNELGQLGNATYTQNNTPVDVVGLTQGVIQLAASYDHTCALTTAGGAKCWGDNQDGQLGDGTTSNRNVPVDVAGLAGGVKQLAAGYYHACAMVEDGRPLCWGSDFFEQLGVGTLEYHATPVDVIDHLTSHIQTNYESGRPGSYFTLFGDQFPPGVSVTVTFNASILTNSILTAEDGSFIIFIDTTTANMGDYLITASANSDIIASSSVTLDQNSPLRPEEGGGQTFCLSSGLAGSCNRLYFPVIRK
jgi:alpha-tubulin suppressor-like RCC1 family protein